MAEDAARGPLGEFDFPHNLGFEPNVILHVLGGDAFAPMTSVAAGEICEWALGGLYSAFEDVKLIGYPEGLWDQTNNLPITRRGMTATDLLVDYNGRPEFLIDSAIFPGSSGSPVYIFDEHPVARKARGRLSGTNTDFISFSSDTRLNLIGILWGVQTYTAEGDVRITTIPSAFDAKALTKLPMNLGVAVKASRLRDFESIFEEILMAQEQMHKKSGGLSHSEKRNKQ